ncbi:MAG TPA: hypothetical protein VMW32_06975 [Bacteroidales bacterium]|nr:hypothetical protein [Bacteroidales bacterium]
MSESKEETITIKSPQDLFEWMSVALGKDPKAIQSMAKYMNLDSNDERSYFPNQLTALAIAQLRILGKAHYPNDTWNEYDLVADYIAIGFMGYKGFKSEQYKDITSGQPNLDKLQGLPEETKKGVLSGIFGRGKKE